MAVRTSLFVFPPPGILALSLILQPSCPAPSNNIVFYLSLCGLVFTRGQWEEWERAGQWKELPFR